MGPLYIKGGGWISLKNQHAGARRRKFYQSWISKKTTKLPPLLWKSNKGRWKKNTQLSTYKYKSLRSCIASLYALPLTSYPSDLHPHLRILRVNSYAFYVVNKWAHSSEITSKQQKHDQRLAYIVSLSSKNIYYQPVLIKWVSDVPASRYDTKINWWREL